MSLDKYLPQGASYEMRVERTKTKSVLFSGNQFESISSADQVSQTVRLLQDGKLSIASSSKPNCSEELIKQAAATVRYGSPHDVPFAEAASVTPLNLEDPSTMTNKELIDAMAGLMDDLRSLDDRLSASTQLNATTREVALQTSNGFDGSYRKSVWSYGGSINLTQGDDRLGIYESRAAMGPTLDIKGVKDTIAKKLEYAKNVVPFKAGAYPVIFTPGEVSFLVNPILASLNGMAVYRQVSPWSDKLGQEMLDKRITLVDDASLDNEYTSMPFDLEGTPTRRNVLVENGRLNGLLLNRKVAALLGKESTGNATMAGPGALHVRLNAGTKPLEELIRSIDYGLLIDGTMGAWAGNPYSGLVSGTISMGLLIEKGQIVGRVKDCMYTINAFEHLHKHLIDFSAETDAAGGGGPMGGGTALYPNMMLDEVVISTK